LEASGRAILPSSNRDLLKTIVEAAARIFASAAASIALVDEAQQELEFVVAHGAGNETVVGMRTPVNAGIAGYVVMTGQPIAVSDVKQDPRFNQDFAQATGYVPRSILATPLIQDDRVIGVMEVLDKIDADSYGMQDIELLGLFARQAAIAIRQSQQHALLNDAILQGIKELTEGDPSLELGAILDMLREKNDHSSHRREMFEIAGIIHAIGVCGEAERAACMQMLGAFKDYLQSRPGVF
jgi:GAF domain-containing protein